MHFRFKPRRNLGSQSQHRSVNRTAVTEAMKHVEPMAYLFLQYFFLIPAMALALIITRPAGQTVYHNLFIGWVQTPFSYFIAGTTSYASYYLTFGLSDGRKRCGGRLRQADFDTVIGSAGWFDSQRGSDIEAARLVYTPGRRSGSHYLVRGVRKMPPNSGTKHLGDAGSRNLVVFGLHQCRFRKQPFADR